MKERESVRRCEVLKAICRIPAVFVARTALAELPPEVDALMPQA